MSTELPSTSGKSVFSVFGFGSGHYTDDEDFAIPLEAAPESFDASDSLTAVTKKKKTPFQEEVMTMHSTETAYQARVNLPDQSGMIFQSFCQSGGKTTPPNQQSQTQPPHQSGVRRYSRTQEEAEGGSGSSDILTKFNNSLIQTKLMLNKLGGSSTNIYSNFAKPGSDTPATSLTTYTDMSPSSLTRVRSSPHLLLVPGMSSPPQGEALLAGNLSQYISRHKSQNDLLEVAEYRANDDPTVTSGSDSSDVKDLALQTYHPPESHKLETEMTDITISPSSGFGILSRTRQFGAWLTKATEGEKVEVTKKDLNVLAPNSF